MLRFLSQNIETKPVPHILSKAYFEADYFRALKAQFPSEDFFARGGGGGQKNKNRLNLETPSTVYDEFLSQAPAWQQLHDYISSDAFIDAVIDKFGESLTRHGCDIHQIRDRVSAKLQICRSFSGYRTPIHTDLNHKIFLSLVYFNNQADYGSGGEFSYYELKALRKQQGREAAFKALGRRLWGGRILKTLLPSRFVEKIGTIVPAENVGISMINSPIGFHKVDRLVTDQQPRRFMYIALMANDSENVWSGFKPFHSPDWESVGNVHGKA